MPITLKALGDQYVKDEFKRNKNATLEQAEEFLQEWKVNILEDYDMIEIKL